MSLAVSNHSNNYRSSDINSCRDWLRVNGLELENFAWSSLDNKKKGAIIFSNGVWWAYIYAEDESN